MVQNYLENSQWLNVDLSLSRHGEGTYLELPSLGRKTEERPNSKIELLVDIGSTAETLVALSTSYMFLACLIPKSTHQDNLTRYGDLVTARRGYDRYDARM